MGDTWFKATGDFFVGPKLWGWLNPEPKTAKLKPLEVGPPQGADYGGSIPILFGRNALQGNIIWLNNNTIDQRVVKVKVQGGGGKGGSGGSKKVKELHCFATFAMALCIPNNQSHNRGTIRRIWCSDKLIYSGVLEGGDIATLSIGGKSCQMTFYDGTQTTIDPLIEADLGTANTPDYEGVAYVVFNDFPLHGFGDSLQGTLLKFDYSIGVPTAAEALLLLNFNEAASTSTFACEITGRTFTTVGTVVTTATNSDSTYNSVLIGGTTNYIYAAADTTFRPSGTGVYTVEATVWIPGAGACVIFDTCQVGDSGGGARNSGFIFYVDSGVPKVFIGGSAISFGNSVSYGAWHDLIFVFDFGTGGTGRTMNVIVDGTPGTPSTTFPSSCWDTDSINLGTQQSGISIGVVGNDPTGGLTAAYQLRKLLITNNAIIDPADRSPRDPSPFPSVTTSDTAETMQLVLPTVFEKADPRLSPLIDDTSGVFIETDDTFFGAISTSAPRQLLDEIQTIYNFDIVCSGYKFKCVRRQNAIQTLDFTIPWDHVIKDTAATTVTIEYEMGTQLPQDYAVAFSNPEREYVQDTAASSFPRVDSGSVETYNSPVAMSFDQARLLADNLRRNSWQEKNTAKFKLPFKSAHPITGAEVQYQRLEPSDVISLETVSGSVVTLLVTGVKDTNGKLEFECAVATVENPKYSDAFTIPVVDIPLTPATTGLILNIPAVSSLMDITGISWAAAPAADGPWDGASLYRDLGSSNFKQIDDTTVDAVIGTVATPLSSHSGNLIDIGTELDVALYVETDLIVSVSKDLMLAGENVALYGAEGRWEIIAYQTAVLNVDGTYTLTGLLRGLYGTEAFTGEHLAGDYFIKLDIDSINFFTVSSDILNVPYDYKTVSYDTDIADATLMSSLAYTGVNLMPFSGVGGKGTRDGSGNFTGTWIRRSRINNGWLSGADTALDEVSESYEIDVMDGATVVRTIAATSPSFTYSAANQTTDFGSTQATILFNIYQLAAIVGRGFAYEVTL